MFYLAAEVHPKWQSLTSAVKKLHARNCSQILGMDLKTPSKFVLAWTPDGAETEKQCSARTGGTGTAIKLASRNGIPVFNMANDDWETRFKLFFQELDV